MQSLFTPAYSTSLIDALFNEIVLKTSNYYYFIGKANEWLDGDYPPTPIDNEYNLKEVRKAVVYLKKINPSDVCYLARRIDWQANTVYDMYDDRYGTEIIGVNILTGGSNYSTTQSNAIITGNGSNANVFVAVEGGQIAAVTFDNNGIGYSSANISFGGPTGSGATGTVVFARSYSDKTNLKDCNFYVLTDDYYVYKCLDNHNNSVSNVKPSLTVSAPFTTADGYKWKFMYKLPEAVRNRFLTANLMPVLTSLNSNYYSNGTILSAVVQESGNNYYSSNTYIVVEGNGYQEGNPREITSANILNDGIAFTSASLAVEPPFTSVAWSSSTAVSAGTRLKYLSNIYSVVLGGTTGVTQPVHVNGSVLNGSTYLKFIGNVANIYATVSSGNITAVTIDNKGFGYSFTPNVTVTGDGVANSANIILTTVKTRANLTPIINSGGVVGVQINSGGIGYTYASANVLSNTGSDARIVIDLSPITGTDSLQVLNEQLAVDGAIDAIKIISNGYGYTEANVTITGDGSGATANATISNGRITSINIVSAGSGYRDATVSITGDGKGATARAILPPPKGHGFNAVRELFASNVGLYSSFSELDNKGFQTVNDFRRLGIVKNIRKYSDDNLFTGGSGSACWLLNGVFDKGNFPIDTELTQASTGGKFLVIDVKDNVMTVISKNAIEPVVGVVTDFNNSFSITSIENPDVDIFSGDILYLLNKDAFVVSSNQSVTVRTVLGF